MLPALVSKEQAAEYLGLKTVEAAEKHLASLGVMKYSFGLIGGKGIRYRRTDIDEALARIAIDPTLPAKAKKKKKKAAPQPNFFSLSIKEQMAFLTEQSAPQ